MNSQTKSPSDRIWAILEEFSAGQKELQAGQKELQASQRKTDLQINKLQAGQKELQASQRKTDLQINKLQAGQKELQASQRKTDLQINKLQAGQKELQAGQKELQAGQKELQASQRKTDLQIQKQGSQFNERWGRMVESLVSGKCVQLLRERGIEVKRIYPNVIGALEKNGKVIKNREFDIIAANGNEAVVFEVKTILSVKSINDFLAVMPDFSKYIPDHRDKTLYAGMAYLKANEHAAALAEKRGLFVIRATGDSASLINKKGFKPKVFSS